MKIQSSILTIIILLLSLSLYSQFGHGSYALGYRMGFSSFESILFRNQRVNGEFEIINEQGMEINSAAAPITAQVYTENVLFDIGLSLRFKKTSKTFNNYTGKDGELWWFNLAFGGYMGQHVGLFVGGKYSHRGLRGDWAGASSSNLYAISNTISTPDTQADFYKDYLGKNEMGASVHLVLCGNDDRIAFHASAVYNWLRHRGIPGNYQYGNFLYTGNSMIFEGKLILCPKEDRGIGLILSGGYNVGQLNAGYFSEERQGEYIHIPTSTFERTYFSALICFPLEFIGGKR